jgi:hypothetical protein
MEKNGRETVAVVLPLGRVPLWDPNNPLPGTCPVPDEVEANWVRDPGTGAFAPPPPPTAAEILADHEAYVQGRLDAFARTRRYDGIVAACSYAASGVPEYRADALRCVEMRDRSWRAFLALCAEGRPLSSDEVRDALPPLEWDDEQEEGD